MSAGVPARRVLWKRLAATVLAVVLTLAAAEGVLRVAEPRAYAERVTHYGFQAGYFGDPPEGPIRVLEPGHVVTYSWDGDPFGTLPPEQRMVCEMNDAGLRGPLPDGDAPTVLFVGDSFTFGEGVDEGETFVRRLAARTDGAVSTVNAGVPGYGSREQRLRTPDWIQSFRPRAVVLVYNLNDPIPVEEALKQEDRFMNVRQEKATGLRLLALFRRAGSDRASEDWYRDAYTGPRSLAWRHARVEIGRMRAAAEGTGARFGVALFPLLHRLDAYPFADLHARIARDLGQDGVEVLDLLPAFAGRDTRSLWVHPTDHHPNAEAHGIAAEALAPFVDRLLGR